MNANAAAESSPIGIAMRDDLDGHRWLFKPSSKPRLVISTDIPCGQEEGDVMWRAPRDSTIAFDYDDWQPAPDDPSPQQ